MPGFGIDTDDSFHGIAHPGIYIVTNAGSALSEGFTMRPMLLLFPVVVFWTTAVFAQSIGDTVIVIRHCDIKTGDIVVRPWVGCPMYRAYSSIIQPYWIHYSDILPRSSKVNTAPVLREKGILK